MTSRNRGIDHRHSLYSRSTRPRTATFAGRSRVRGFSLLGTEDIVHQPGWDLWLL
ncbi:hypothetical protein QBC36DRAFT_325898 [Triangularia setosa]|uniref:Uncharacterized protein n=1 Tax=Triangularia setosa TaxID=2587417 RepID=A0AAN6WCC2_9PEZI|nr:hypothetical protein QBC36DRAFT_325898 [Podospora setosa]